MAALNLSASASAVRALSGACSGSEDAVKRVSVRGNSQASSASLSTSLAATPVASSVKGRAVAARVAAEPTSTENAEKTATRYHFVVANAKFMLDDEEHFQEQLKERLRWVNEQGRGQDFWLLYEPAFLESFPEITKRLKRPAVALVSTDGPWITFMKIRLDRVLMGEFECDTQEEALQAKPIDIKFEKPASWTAPYTKYADDWWKPYVPQ